MQNQQENNQSNNICDLKYTNDLLNQNEKNCYNFSFQFPNTQNPDIEISYTNCENVCIDEQQNTMEIQIIEVDSKFQEYRKSDSDKYKKLFLKLQKLNKIYSDSLLLQIEFPHYLKSSIQVLKKANQSRNLSNNIIKFIVHYAQYKTIDQQYLQISPKIQKLCQEFDKIDNFQLVDLKQFLSKQNNDSIENVWTKQQIIQCFILYVVTQCEMFISNFYKIQQILIRNKDISNHTKMCTYDYSWSENCFGNIRDFNQKLAQKLNKRYQIIRNINQEDKQKSISIFNYTQSVLGYYHHYYSYSKMKLERENKEKIKQILQNQQVECDLQTLLIIANARMYVQLLYSLNDLQKL